MRECGNWGPLVFQVGGVESALGLASMQLPAMENVCQFNEAQREGTIEYTEIKLKYQQRAQSNCVPIARPSRATVNGNISVIQ